MLYEAHYSGQYRCRVVAAVAKNGQRRREYAEKENKGFEAVTHGGPPVSGDFTRKRINIRYIRYRMPPHVP
jgi:hypothetical protein